MKRNLRPWLRGRTDHGYADCSLRISALLVKARLVAGEPEQVGRLRTDALGPLVYRPALADPLTAMRLVTAAEAPASGARLARVGAALGLDIDDLTAGLRSWADASHQHTGMSADAHAEVHARPDDREVGR